MDSAGKERGMTGESSFLCTPFVRGGLPRLGAVWTLSDSLMRAADSSSELLTAVLELLTARESCSERVVIVIIVDGPAGPL